MRRFTLVAFLAVAAIGGCSDYHVIYSDLYPIEIEYLSEDVLDLMTIVFQAGENAFVGDAVQPEDIVDPGGPGNDFTATYDLPTGPRVGLGDGSGRVALQVIEDGVFNEEPLLFSISTTTALEVEITYELRYDGETLGGRFTEVDLLVSVIATRATALDPFDVDYFIDGQTFLGFTFTEITTQFFSPGRPRDGVIVGLGDGEGTIDDPEVDAGIFDFDLDWDDADTFRAEGEVGSCCWFDERFFFADVF